MTLLIWEEPIVTATISKHTFLPVFQDFIWSQKQNTTAAGLRSRRCIPKDKELFLALLSRTVYIKLQFQQEPVFILLSKKYFESDGNSIGEQHLRII